MSRQTLAPDALDAMDRQILNRLQDGFPLTPHPFDDAAAPLGLTGDQLIERLSRLREIGAITVSARFSTRPRWVAISVSAR